jgi:hypothetical protein
MFVKRLGVLYGGHTEHVTSCKLHGREPRRSSEEVTMESSARRLPVWMVTLPGVSNHLCRSLLRCHLARMGRVP